jgi:hypothetical protein
VLVVFAIEGAQAQELAQLFLSCSLGCKTASWRSQECERGTQECSDARIAQ